MRLRQDTEEHGGSFWTTTDGFIGEYREPGLSGCVREWAPEAHDILALLQKPG